MKDFDEILKDPHFSQIERSLDGFRAVYASPYWIGSIVCSNEAGWEHVSVAPFKRTYTPTWNDMTTLKDLFFNDNEAVIQIHPPKEEYVNNISNCLHLWRCTYKPMVLPPSCLVGIRKGQSKYELMKEIKEAYAMAGEVYDGV